jgi:outer membrane protein assembly factor BamB
MRKALYLSAAVFSITLATLLPRPGAGQNPPADAKATLERIGTTRGICVVLGDPQAALAVELAKASDLIVYLQSAKADEVAAARKAAEAAGLLGTRVYVEQGKLDRIHLADNLADAVVVAGGAGDAPPPELLRVLRPEGKVLVGKTEVVKPFPKDTDEWSHPYHGPDNNPQSKDKIARGPFLTHFLAEPWYSAMPEMTVIAGGRIFKAFGNRTSQQPQWPMLNKLLCMNAFNGAILWQRELTPGFMLHRNTLVATPKVLFLGDDVSCKLIDTATGKVTSEIVVPGEISDGPVWKWMVVENGILYALVGEKEPQEQVVRTGGFRGAGWPWWGIKDYPYGFGRTILAIDPATKKVLWHHREQERLDCRAMGMSAGKIFFYSDQKFLAALDAKTGKVAWKTSDKALLEAIGPHKPAQNPGEGFASTSYVKCSEKALFFAGPTRSNIVGVSAENGKLLWQHADGNAQLVLRDDGLYCLGRGRAMVGQGSLKLDPQSGEILARFPSRDRCTRATGCIDSIFTRGGKGGSTAVFDVSSREPKVTTLSPMRPACQDGVVVAHGHLYWGPWMCRCDSTQIGAICLESAVSFNFDVKATDKDRLEPAGDPAKAAAFPVTADDWPTYRKDNARSTRTDVTIGNQVKQQWQYTPTLRNVATAPVTASGVVFVSGSDGAVRGVDAATGKQRWSAYTGGAVKYPPSLANGRLYVGSGDGWVYCLEAASGKQLWRFRAAPQERKVPIFGSLMSTWPVAGGVLVEDGVAYAAAGTFNYNGIHVYALDAPSGKIRWQNNTSGAPNPEAGATGAGVQGHLLLHGKALCLAGGNTSAVATYDIGTGKYTQGGGGGGKDLYLINGQVRASGFPLYWRPEDSHFISQVDLATPAGTIACSTAQVALNDPKLDPPGKPKSVWTAQPFQENAAVAVTKNAVILAGVDRTQLKDGWQTTAGLTALSLTDGKPLWKLPLPAAPVAFGLAVDRDGKILVSLQDGRVMCFQ